MFNNTGSISKAGRAYNVCRIKDTRSGRGLGTRGCWCDEKRIREIVEDAGHGLLTHLRTSSPYREGAEHRSHKYLFLATSHAKLSQRQQVGYTEEVQVRKLRRLQVGLITGNCTSLIGRILK